MVDVVIDLAADLADVIGVFIACGTGSQDHHAVSCGIVIADAAVDTVVKMSVLPTLSISMHSQLKSQQVIIHF